MISSILKRNATILTDEEAVRIKDQVQAGLALLWLAGRDVPPGLTQYGLLSPLASYQASGDAVTYLLDSVRSVFDKRMADCARAGLTSWVVSPQTPQLVVLLGSDFPYTDYRIARQLDDILKTVRAAGARVFYTVPITTN